MKVEHTNSLIVLKALLHHSFFPSRVHLLEYQGQFERNIWRLRALVVVLKTSGSQENDGFVLIE